MTAAGGLPGTFTTFGGAGDPPALTSLTAPVITQDVPAEVSLPAVTGIVAKGVALHADPGVWTNEPTSYAYQWQKSANGVSGWADIVGATADTYTPVVGDVGAYLRVVVTATNGSGAGAPASSPATSQVAAVTLAVDPVTPPPLAIPSPAANPTLFGPFSPPAKSLVLVGISAAANGLAAYPVASVGDGTNAYAELVGDFLGGDVASGIYCFYYDAAPGPITLQIAFNVGNVPAQGGLITVEVLDGAAPVQNGQTAQQAAAGQVPSVSLVTTHDGSWVFAQQANFDSALEPTVPDGQTIVFNGHTMFATLDGNGYWTQATVVPTPLAGTDVTINDTAPANLRVVMVAAEILRGAG